MNKKTKETFSDFSNSENNELQLDDLHDNYNNISIYANYDVNAPSIGDAGLLHGQIQVHHHDKHRSRLSNIIYSGDLIQLICCNNSILTYYGNDLLMLQHNSQQSEKKNLLTKLRLIADNHNSNQRLLIPITYGQNVFMEFNILGDSQSRFIGYDQKLQVLPFQKSQLFRLYKASNLLDRGIIRIGDQIIIAITGCPQNQNNIYLTVNNDYSIRTDGFYNQAIHFEITTNIGCGPNWIYDQDTRSLGDQQLTQLEHQKQVSEKRDKLSRDLNNLQNNFLIEEKQFNSQCQEKIFRETKINDELKKQLAQIS